MGQNVKVLVRVRPLLSFENDPIWMIKSNSLHTVTVVPRSQRNSSTQKKILKENKQLQFQFHFESVINENMTSQQIYKREIRTQLLQCCQMRRDVSIMAYGQTCSGKTHTILGIQETPGIIPCVFRDLFLLKQEKNKKFSIKISYNQIYNEKISDLLDLKEKTIKVVEKSVGNGFELFGNSKESINSFEDALNILQRGEKRRQYGQGEYHDRSSRSHTLLSIFIGQWDSNLQVKSFSISIVDLAGSQRLTHERQSSQQAGFINKSLFQLTNCISKLAQKAAHVPFRDSKLTKLLETSLTGSGRSFIICCVSPSKSCLSETLSTLRLAERAKKIELNESFNVQLRQNETQRLKSKLQRKTKECNILKQEIDLLKEKIAYLENELNKSKHRDLKFNKSITKEANLLILLDHENFTLFVQDHISQQFSQSEFAKQLKQNFVQKLQALYESYTKEIVKYCYGDTFELQIQQLCFMNMVLEHQKISEYKIEIISQLLKQQDQKCEQSVNSLFYDALLKYQNKLKSKHRSIDEISSYRSSHNRNHSQHNNSGFITHKSIENNNYSNHFSITPETLSIKRQKQKGQVFGTEILVWGTKKDFRVCKGNTSLSGIVRISHLGKIRSVVCGYHHTLVVTEQGKLYGWGKNTEKQLINCEKESVSTTTEIKSVKRVKSVAAGWGHSLALTFQGQLYSWGFGKDGQLGHGNRQSCASPTIIVSNHQISSIYAGHSHSAFLDILGNLYTFGFNQDYRLMIGESKEVLQPRRISIRDVTNVSLGVTHSAIITSNGSVFAGGSGRNGQLGIQLNQQITGWEKIQAIDRKFEQQTFEKICPLIQVENFGRNRRAKDVKCGQNMTIILSQQGEVYTFGKQLSHRLGHGMQKICKILQKIGSIQCGSRNGFALNQTQNKLYSWGFNMYGQANPQITGDISTPQLFQGLAQRKILHISSGFFHSALLLQ